MENALQFLDHYNPQIIQTGFAIVFLLIIVYVYRLFFMAGGADVETTDLSHSPAIEQKLNQILEQQKIRSTTGATSAVSSVDRSDSADEEIDKLKAEIYNLRQQLNDAEKKVFEAPTSDSEVRPAENSSSEGTEDTSALTGKIKELEARLAEYEIIADDIAELSQLRTDNARLKAQLAGGETAAAPRDAANEAVSGDVANEVIEVDVPVQDQNLLNEFEATITKKENE
ncbi:MAG: hypothetical protein A2622_01630 [Bdellovibrionales bacterium RIFCSPHIGHO2_01_FULL_40_29]|nr:MAG: hypothetical protein A2622_01630 [Bdellovibrionales bacterium RIFCSPHIGHO2_01_FULL_40_29]OFZ33796.1 MAG: hypothetical protein A3D17_02050 [Bdellovibrionales bacterium RIFCSPHIGHO2_02_FULL_40_15]